MSNEISTWAYFKQLFKVYKSKSNSVIVSLIVITTYLLWFTLGLIFGGAFSTAISTNVANYSGWFSTIIVFSLGAIIIYNSIFRHHPIIILSVITMMGANISYSLGLFTIPVVDFMFDLATIFTMLVLYCFSSSKDCLLHMEARHE